MRRVMPVAALTVALLWTSAAEAAMPTFVDTSGLLTVQDRQVIESIVTHYATGSRSVAARMDDAEDAIEDYLERQYGDDVYDVDTKIERGGEGVTLIAHRRSMRLDPHHMADGRRVTDATDSLTAGDMTRIEAILARAAASGWQVDAAEDAVERYLDGQYGNDFYEADVVRAADGYRVVITAD